MEKSKRKSIFESYRGISDLLILQETHSSQMYEKMWETEWGGDIIFNHGTSASRGLAVLMKKGMKNAIKNIYKDEEGRTIVFDILENDTLVTIVALYAPNVDCPKYFQDISFQIKERSENKILIGDFNLALDVELDRKNTYYNNNKSLEVVQSLMEEYCLVDVWRLQNGETREYSWFKRGEHLQKASRIDFALVSLGLDQKAKALTYLPSIMSDHRPLYMVIDLQYSERGVGFWKLNTKYLHEQSYIDRINEEIKRTIESSDMKSAVERWELIKQRVKKCTVKYAREAVSEEKIIIGQLTEKVNEYQARLPLDQEEDRIMQETLHELEEKILERTKSMLFRSKMKWVELGEKSSKYFFSLEKARYNAKTCYKLIGENEMEITNQEDILKQQHKFYKELYQKDEGIKFDMVNSYGVTVPEFLQRTQEQQVTMVDLENAIKFMNNQKTPGEDGIPVDFYKVFWRQIKTPFLEMVEEVYESKTLHETARRGILNLIPKPNKDSRYIKNLRPITLLNTDYKIIEKAVANMMIPALKHIIHQDQRGFMKDRRISVNIRKMLDIIHYAQEEDLEAVILSLDFVKCFDKCSFSILYGSLDFFEFGSKVKDWTKILYKDFTVKIQNNGHFSSEIDIQKGVHQGGCCSSVYFLVIAEILALMLRSNDKIEGITMRQLRNLLNQFADDMDIFSMCKEESIRNIYKELTDFHHQSGFTVSYDKTTLYRIGSLRFSSAQLYGMSEYVWSNEDINVLGVTIAHEDLVSKNYDRILLKVATTLGSWHNRCISLIGKVLVVNTLVGSLFVHKMMVLPRIPDKIVKIIDNMVREYLWGGKKAKIAYNILQNNKKEGGLGLIDLKRKDASMKATWPLILEKEQQYAKMVYSELKCESLGEDIWRCNLKREDIVKMRSKNDFWKDVLIAWNEYNKREGMRIENQILWYNSEIRFKNKPFFWRDVYDRGLRYVYQLYQDKQFKSPNQLQREFGLSHMRVNSLKAAIPKKWKEYFMEEHALTYNPIPPHNYDLCRLNCFKNFSSRVYKLLGENVSLIHNKYMKWSQELGHDFCESLVEYGSKHTEIYKVTNIPKYRSFQYRLLQRGVVTNILLYKWKISQSDKCSFCKEQREDIMHMLYECVNVKKLWYQVAEFIEKEYAIKVELSVKNVLFNEIYSKKKRHVANFICLITKQFIYRQRCLGGNLHFPVLKNNIGETQRIEKYIAMKNGKIAQHNRKWCIQMSNDCVTQISDIVQEYLQDVQI